MRATKQTRERFAGGSWWFSTAHDTFPGFRDVVDTSDSHCEWEMAKKGVPLVVHFYYKQAQIATADLWAALGRR